MLGSFDHVLAFNSFLKLLWINLLDLVGFESSFQEFFHLVSLLTFSFIDFTVLKFNINKSLVKIFRLVHSDWSSFAVLFLIFRKGNTTIAFLIFLLHFPRIDLIGNKSAQHHNHKE